MSKDDMVSRLRETYALVAEWPEHKPDGFANLLVLRNLVPEAAARITALEAEVDAKNSLIAEMKDKHGALICGPCADEAYLSEWMAYGRALQQALSAQPQKEEAAGWMVERPLRDGGTHLYLPFLRTREEMERYAKANSHETLVALYRSTPVQVQESQTVSEEMVTLPRDQVEFVLEALTETRSASIAGCESDGYSKPQLWADRLYRSHGGLTASIKALTAALEPSHVKG